MPPWLVTLFSRYGYAALFAGVFLENLGIPLPGETVLLAAGFFAKRGLLRLSIIIPCAIVAAILGDNAGYWIGRRGGRRFVERHGRVFGLSPERLSNVETYFRQHGPRTVFLARFISGVRVLAALTAGISGLPWPRFLLYNAAGAVAWGTSMAVAGFLFGQSWTLLEHWVGDAGLVVLTVVGAAILLALLRRHRRRIASRIADLLPEGVTLYEGWLLAVSAVAIGLLGKITEDVVTREATPFDAAVWRWITALHVPDPLMSIANTLGSAAAVAAVSLAVIVRALLRGERVAVAILAALAAMSQLLGIVFGNGMQRVQTAPLNSYFPSGHAVNAVAVYGFIAMLTARRRPLARRWLTVLVCAIAIAVGAARVSLRLDWPTDVLGGYCLGLLLLSVAVFWLDRLEPEEPGK